MIGANGALARRLGAALAALRLRFGALWLLVVALIAFAGAGLVKLDFDDELLRFFKSDLAAYEHFAEALGPFEGDSNDMIVLVEADDLARPEVMTAISDFLLEAQFVEGVRAAVSPLALRLAGADGVEAPLVPFPPPARAEMAARLDAARAQIPALGQLMSADRTAMIAVLPLMSFGPERREDRMALIDRLGALAATAEAASGARVRLSGYVVLRDAVARALTRDIILLNLAGVLVGFGIAVIALRSFRLGLLTLPGPVLGLFTTLGIFGHLGVSINTVTVALPLLVLVLGASDAIHISYERGRQGRRDTRRATLRAVRRVAVACVFAAVTTALAFAALALSRTDVFAEMGRIGALVTLVSTLVVLLTQTLVLSWAGRFAWFQPLFDRINPRAMAGFGFGLLPRLALAAPRTVTAAGLGVLAVTAVLYAQAGPRYSILDSLHPDAPVLQSFRAIEDKVTPISLLQIPVASGDPEVVARVAAAAERISGLSGAQSIGELAGTGAGVEDLPEALARRVISQDGTRALVNLPFRYETGDQALALAARLDEGLAADPALGGAGVGAVTGLPVMAAAVAGDVLGEINRSLLFAVGAVAVLIWVWLGALRVALISLIPNMLPVTIIGAWLMLSGRGIEFSNALALTVAFGIAVDDTLHVLNRLRLSGGVARIERARLAQALDEVTPALVTTSLVLIFGTFGAFFAENRSVYDFGKVAMAVFFLALIADLLVLPAVLAVFGPKSYLRRKEGRG